MRPAATMTEVLVEDPRIEEQDLKNRMPGENLASAATPRSIPSTGPNTVASVGGRYFAAAQNAVSIFDLTYL